MDLAFLNTVGIIGVMLSAIPFGMGFWFMVLPVLSRFGFIGFLYFPAYLIYGLIKHHEDVEYGFSLFLEKQSCHVSISSINSILLT